MLAAPRASPPPRSPRDAVDARSDSSENSGLKIRTGAKKTGAGRKTRAQQLAEWKLRRAAAALENSSVNSSHARGMSSKRRRSDAAAVVAAKKCKANAKSKKNVYSKMSTVKHRKIKPSIKSVGAETSTSAGPTMMIDLRGLTNSSPDCAACESPCAKPKKPAASPGLRALQNRLQGSAKKQKDRLRSGVSSETMLLKQRLSAKKKKKKQKTSTKKAKSSTAARKNVASDQTAKNRKRKARSVASRYAQPKPNPSHDPKAHKRASAARDIGKRRRVASKRTLTQVSKVSSVVNTSSLSSGSSGASRAAHEIESRIPAQRKQERINRIRIMAMGDIDMIEDHLKWGRHQQACKVLSAMSPETEVTAKTFSKYWVQRVQIEEHKGNHAAVQALIKMAGEHMQNASQIEEFKAEKAKYFQRTARWKSVASAQKDKEKQQLDDDNEFSELDISIVGDSNSVGRHIQKA